MTESQSQICLNCGAALDGKFCADCGQRDIPPYPTVRELAHDAVADFSGWDGRLAATLRALVQLPGFLTRERPAGRRARYVAPVRVQLTAGVLYLRSPAPARNLRLESGELGHRIETTTRDSDATAAAGSRARRGGKVADSALESGKAAT